MKRETGQQMQDQRLDNDLDAEGAAAAPGRALTASFANDAMDLAADASDATLDALVTSGALESIPILGLVSGVYKASRHIPALLYQRKVARMLAAAATNSSPDERKAFTDKVEKSGNAERLGEAVLLMLDKVDEIEKPAIIGRLIAAHMRGVLERSVAFRLCSMVNRAYYGDLKLLCDFAGGAGAPFQTEFGTLAAVGLLDNDGFDGGYAGSTDPMTSGGDLYSFNRYSEALVRYGFEVEPIPAASRVNM